MPGVTDLVSLLQHQGLITAADARRLREAIGRSDRPPIHALRSSRRVTDAQILAALQEHLGLAAVDPRDEAAVDIDALRWLSQDLAEEHLVLPLRIDRTGARSGAVPDPILHLAMADPMHVQGVERLEQASGLVVAPHLADAGLLEEAVGRFYGRIATRLIPRPEGRGRRPAARPGWTAGPEAAEPETQPVHRLEDEATPAQLVQALVRVLEQRRLIEREEFMAALKAVLRGEGDG